MKINAFAEKYGVDRRSIDYWTTIGLLHPEVNPKNGYRSYNEKAEEEIKLILIAQAMNCASIEETVDLIKHTPKECWNRIIIQQIQEEMQRVTKRYIDALEYAKAMKRD